ncbi:hypothetical protein SLS62_005141 [Diatrype stigma]|uniref:Uncharacterized protein n=1 Tax=Diatrype stigma TaxID=117547 RepID=A0AAN9UPF9_9PEZI
MGFDCADPVILIKNGKFSWEPNKAALQNVTTRVAKSSLTMVVGPVGSGKSSFCKALLGEIPFSEGSVTVGSQLSHVGFCDQTAFLWNGTIRDNIIGFSSFDDHRYSEVIRATALSIDLAKFPQGDSTNIGSDGITLSGGQKQRVSLARALYLQTDLLILDDIFSGLDADTEQEVFRQVFGANGLLKQRRSTTVLCTHSVKYLSAADYVIALENGSIIEQGLTFWADDVSSGNPTHSHAYYVWIYALLQVLGMISLLLLAIVLFIVSVKKAGANLHRVTLQTLIRAPLQLFTKTDTGVITNLFSQDLNLIDTELPDALLNTLFCVSQAIGQAAVMLTSSAYLAISYPLLAGLLYVVQVFYLRTSRQLRLLDLETKSPLYSGFAGASFVTLMAFGENLSGIVIYYTRLETSIGAISRLKDFNETVKPEDRDDEDILPPEQWPQSGVVELKGISASYDDITVRGGAMVKDGTTVKSNTNSLSSVNSGTDSPSNLALRDINLTIESGEKIAICGRTGSGKSSLISLLLKILDPLPGTRDNAVIDAIPLHRIHRSTLRQHIIAVPQEAVFLPDGSTFQTNLDPSNVSTHEECETILSAVGLWEFAKERGGLEAGMSAGTLSAGQRQLLSLGRAVLRRRIRTRNSGPDGRSSGILLLDEVNSSVDHDTERTMQDIIKTEFQGYTVIAVSHRLDMIMDFDRVIVMDTGKIVEVGNPVMLSNIAGTKFASLVKAGSK